MYQYTAITKYYFCNQILKGGVWFTVAGIHNKEHIIFLQALQVYTKFMKLFTQAWVFSQLTLSHLLIRPNINNTQNVQRYNLKTIIPRTLSSVNLVK